MTPKKFWPLLALAGVGLLLGIWYVSRPQPQDSGNKSELSQPAQAPEPASKTPAPEPAAAPGPAAPAAPLPPAPPAAPEKPPAAAAKAHAPSGAVKEYGVATKKFRTFPQAKKFLAQLRRQGHRGYITKAPKDKNPFTVWLGPYQTRHEAQAAARLMKKKCRIPTQVKAKEILPPK